MRLCWSFHCVFVSWTDTLADPEACCYGHDGKHCTVFPDPDSGCSVFSGGCFTVQTALFGSDLLIVNICVKSKVLKKKQMMICFEGQALHFLFCQIRFFLCICLLISVYYSSTLVQEASSYPVQGTSGSCKHVRQ